MDRILRNTTATISATFSVDGAGVDPVPDTATVEIFRDDGTVLVAQTLAANVVGQPGRFAFPLTTDHTALLDTLTARWVSSLGIVDTTVEIAGGFHFTIAQARAMAPLSNTTVYPTARVQAMRTTVEQAIEDACEVAFVPRYARETFDGGTGTIVLRPMVTAVRAATVEGTALTAGELGELARTASGIYSPSGWTLGYGNVEIIYEHGYSVTPARVSQAALRLAKTWLVEGPIDDRATGMATPDGGSYQLVTPGLRGSYFGLPEVDAVVRQYGLRSGMV